MVEGLGEYSYEDRLRILGLTTLETRFLRADLIEVFKILKGFENLDPDRFFQVVGDGAKRGHSFKLFKLLLLLIVATVNDYINTFNTRIHTSKLGKVG